MTTNQPIRLLLVDDHTIFIDGLTLLLSGSNSVEVVDTALSTAEAMLRLKTLEIDVVITDLNMPEEDGIALIRQAGRLYPHLRFIALTMVDDAGSVVETLDAGADAYLLKNTSLQELLRAIETVSEGNSFVSPAINNLMIAQLRRQQRNEEQLLTRRELEVLQQVTHGKTSKEIAEELNLSLDTIKFHRKNILSKLNQPNTAALVNFAIEHRLVARS